jgi:hypothetical protein
MKQNVDLTAERGKIEQFNRDGKEIKPNCCEIQNTPINFKNN